MYVHSFILLVWAPFCARELELFLCSECYRSFELFLPQFTGNTEAHRTTQRDGTQISGTQDMQIYLHTG